MKAALGAADYFSRIGSSDRSAAAIVDAQLKGVTEYLCRRLGRQFTQSETAEVRYFTATNPTQIVIDDYVSISALAIDALGGDDYATTVASGDYVKTPENALAWGEPYKGIRLLTSASIITGTSYFPTRADGYHASVKVTGIFGWPATPDAFKDLVVMVTRQLRDLQKDGITITSQVGDSAVQLAPGASSLMKDIKNAYTRVRMAM